MAEHLCAENMHWHLNLQHFGNTNLKYLEVTGACRECGAKASFRGPLGQNPSYPTVALDGSEAVFPFVMEGEEYDGKAIGYSLAVTGGN